MYNCIVEYTAGPYLHMLVLYSHKKTCTGSVRRKGGKRGRERERERDNREGEGGKEGEEKGRERERRDN